MSTFPKRDAPAFMRGLPSIPMPPKGYTWRFHDAPKAWLRRLPMGSENQYQLMKTFAVAVAVEEVGAIDVYLAMIPHQGGRGPLTLVSGGDIREYGWKKVDAPADIDGQHEVERPEPTDDAPLVLPVLVDEANRDDLPASDHQLKLLAGTIASAFPGYAILAGVVTVSGERRLHWHIATPSGAFANLQQPFEAFKDDATFEQVLGETVEACHALQGVLV